MFLSHNHSLLPIYGRRQERSHLQLQNIHICCSMDSHSLSSEAGEISAHSNRSTRLFVPRSTILSQHVKGGEITILRSRLTRSIVPHGQLLSIGHWRQEICPFSAHTQVIGPMDRRSLMFIGYIPAVQLKP